MAVVRAYTMEAREIADFGRLNDELPRAVACAWRACRRASRRSWGSSPASAGSSCCGLGGSAVVDGRITLGALVAFNGYLALPRVADDRARLDAVESCGAASPRWQRIPEILDDARRPPTRSERRRPGAAAARRPIRVRAISRFRLRGPGAACSTTSASRCRRARLVAVVGPTGSGKSTLGLLLCRLCEPPPGHRVRRRRRRARRCPAHRLRRTVGVCAAGGLPVLALAPRQRARSPARRRPEHLRGAAAAAGLGEEVESLPRRAGTRWSASAASRCRAASASGWRWRARSWAAPPYPRPRRRASPAWTPPRKGRSCRRCGRR